MNLLIFVILLGTLERKLTDEPSQNLCNIIRRMTGYTEANKNLIQTCLKQGASCYIRLAHNRGDLMSTAIQHNDQDMVTLLLHCGYDINHLIEYTLANTIHYETPLMIAIRYKKSDIIQLLVSKGANTLAANYEGETAKQLDKDNLLASTAYSSPCPPPSQSPYHTFWIIILLVGSLALLQKLVICNVPVTMTITGAPFIWMLPLIVTAGIILQDLAMSQSKSYKNFLENYYCYGDNKPLLHILPSLPSTKRSMILKKAYEKEDLALVKSVLQYPTYCNEIEHHTGLQELLEQHPNTAQAILHKQPSDFDKQHIPLLMQLHYQHHLYKKTWKSWLRSFFTPGDTILTEPPSIRLTAEQVELIQQRSKSNIDDLKNDTANINKIKEVIQQVTVKPLTTTQWKTLKKKLLLAFHVDKIGTTPTRTNNFRVIRDELNKVGADALALLIKDIQPSQTDSTTPLTTSIAPGR